MRLRPILFAAGGALLLIAGGAALMFAQTQNGLGGLFASFLTASQPDANAQSGPATSAISRKDYQDWLLVCPEEGAEAASCVVVQNHVANDSAKRIMMIQLRPAAAGGFELALVTPNNVSLAAGISIQIDENEASRLSFDHCTANDCIATVRMNDESLQRLAAAGRIHATYQMVSGQIMRVGISPSGLKDAIDAVTRS